MPLISVTWCQKKKVPFKNNALQVCLKNRQCGEAQRKQSKFLIDCKLSAELSTGSVDRLDLAHNFFAVQQRRESCKGRHDNFS